MRHRRRRNPDDARAIAADWRRVGDDLRAAGAGPPKMHILLAKMELKPSGELATHETARILRALGIRASDFGILIG